MPGISRKGDSASGHGCFPPTSAVSASPNVYINDNPALRQGDAVAAHGCGKCPPHPRSVAGGSATVFVNGRPVARLGDSVDCGGAMAAASGNVYAGG
ncbi:PAAR domain-containing protein [Roseinatronobacter monicus]|uniref:Putative Zn-binding protein involved in type VI secretion n=1 Tax=Roseinatronobacter monicus TaxID=393481 RepID=A0A543KIK1_9RHOB|nr:PAAR domain-containing protein [Roseinatronobacter monicus]TQM94909.1 putative Zn-binding protein involved in type VI secretion [Roseinatronobacter monicus]